MSSSYNDLHDIISMLRNCNIIRLEKLFRSTYIPFYLSFYVISWKRIISIDAYSSYNWDTIYNARDVISIVPSLDITHFEKESITKRVNNQIIIEMQFIYLSIIFLPLYNLNRLCYYILIKNCFRSILLRTNYFERSLLEI